MFNLNTMSDEEVTNLMQVAARSVQGALGMETLFMLVVFDDPACVQYISTCDRPTVIKALRLCADRLEHGEGKTIMR